MSPLIYQIGLPIHHRQRAAALYEEAFRQKLRPAIPDQGRRVAILAESIVTDRAVVALADDTLLGLAGFHHGGKSFTGGGSASGVFKQLGLWRGVRAIAFLTLERKPAPELLMDLLCWLRGFAVLGGLTALPHEEELPRDA